MLTMKPQPLQHGETYHIYNRGNNGETLFRQQRNYRHFLNLYTKHINPIANTYAYCLMPNHFHLLVHINNIPNPLGLNKSPRSSSTDPKGFSTSSKPSNTNPTGFKKRTPSQAFSNFFNAYTKAINKAYGRTGSLFENPFHRIPVHDSKYFWNLVIYIHQNPQRHGFVDDFRDWPYTSYEALTNLTRPTKIARDDLLARFGGREAAVEAHINIISDFKGLDYE